MILSVTGIVQGMGEEEMTWTGEEGNVFYSLLEVVAVSAIDDKGVVPGGCYGDVESIYDVGNAVEGDNSGVGVGAACARDFNVGEGIILGSKDNWC